MQGVSRWLFEIFCARVRMYVCVCMRTDMISNN